MSAGEVRARLERAARDAGFIRIGVTSLEPFTEAASRGIEAIEAGRMDGMAWMHRRRFEHAAAPHQRYPWARSFVSFAWPYPPSSGPVSGHGRVAAYAALEDPETGRPIDYHELLPRQINRVLAELRESVPELRSKVFCDHGWSIDRAVAARGAIGFAGKHTGLITKEAGSYVLLAEALLSVDLEADAPVATNCGTCTRCLPACPTGALIAPGVIDARRCISYLTIEHDGPIPPELREAIGDWVFGCDICQQACPINERLAPAARERSGFDLIELLELNSAAFNARFAGTPLHRSGRERLARNAAIALGNVAGPEAVAALRRAASSDPDATVRDAASWAAERIAARSQRGRTASAGTGRGTPRSSTGGSAG